MIALDLLAFKGQLKFIWIDDLLVLAGVFTLNQPEGMGTGRQFYLDDIERF